MLRIYKRNAHSLATECPRVNMEKRHRRILVLPKHVTAVTEFQLHGRKPKRRIYFKRGHTADGSDRMHRREDIRPLTPLIIANTGPAPRRAAPSIMPHNCRIVLLSPHVSGTCRYKCRKTGLVLASPQV
jgi:hypothetical protein